MPPTSMSSPENSRLLRLLFSNNPNYGYHQFPGVPLKIAGWDLLFSYYLNLNLKISNFLLKSDYFKHFLKNYIFQNSYKFFDLFCIKVNFALSIMKYTVHLPLYLTQLSLLLRAVNKLCLQLSVEDSVVSNIMGGELYISLYLEQNSPL